MKRRALPFLLGAALAASLSVHALDGDLDFVNQLRASQKLAQPSSVDIARGKIPGWDHTNKFGENPDVDGQEDIWADDGLYVPPTTAMVHSVVSTQAVDDNGNTGAWTVTIEGLDSSWAPISETVTLDGTTPVVTTNLYLRVNRAWVATAGTGVVNAGNITITMQDDPFTVSGYIGAGDGQTLQAVYSIPDGYTGYVTRVRSALVRNTNGNNAADLRLYARHNLDADPSLRVKDSWSVSVNGATNLEYSYDPPKVIAGPADVFIRAEAVTASNTILSASFDLIEISDTAD